MEILDAQFKRFKTGEGKFLLRQMEREAASAISVSRPYQPNREVLFSSLFYISAQGTLLEQAVGDLQDFLLPLQAIADLFVKALPESLLAKTLARTLSQEQEEELSQMQLWWEKEFGEAGDQETKKLIIQKTLTPVNPGQPSSLMDYLKQAQKSSFLSPAEKVQLNRLRVELGKR